MSARLHYFCPEHWAQVPHGPEMLRHESGRELPPVTKKCCWCSKRATRRARSELPSRCPPGHIPPRRFNEIFARAMAAAIEDSDLPRDVELEVEAPNVSGDAPAESEAGE